MTREEAIKLIEHISIAFVPTDQYGDYDDPQPYEEALDMAIEALSAEAVSHEDTVTLNSPITIQAEMVPVVRCKDCKHRNYEGWCDVYMQPRMDTDFCNHGERQCNYFGCKGGENK